MYDDLNISYHEYHKNDQQTTTFTIIDTISISKIFIGLIMTCVSLTACIGNLFVITAMKVDKNLRTASNYFILSLSVSDFLVGLFVMPLTASYTLMNQKWIFGKVICNIWLSLDYTASTASIFNLFALSVLFFSFITYDYILQVDRYLSINEPLKYLSKRTKNRVFISILFVWFVSLLWTIPINFESIFKESKNVNTTLIYENHKCFTVFETNQLFKIITTVINFYVPLIGMSLIYIKIFLTIRNRSKIEISRRFSDQIKSVKRGQLCSNNEYSNIKTDSVTRLSEYENHSDLQIPQNDHVACSLLFKKINSSQSDSNIYELKKLNISTYKNRKIKSSHFQYTYDETVLDPKCEMLVRYLYKYKYPAENREHNHKVDSLVKTKSELSLEKVTDKKVLYTHLRVAWFDLVKKFRIKPKQKIQYIRKRRNCLVEIQKNSTQLQITNDNYSNLNSNNTNKLNFNKILSTSNKFYNHSLRKQIKAARQLGILLGAFLVLWLPYFILFMVVAFCIDCIPEYIYTITIWLGYVNSAINPILYPLCNSGFKIAFRRMLRLNTPIYKRKDFMQILNYTTTS